MSETAVVNRLGDLVLLAAYLAGFALSASLILAIGAQNALVLRQGLRGVHVGPVVAICCLSEAILIATGVAGFGALAEALPWALEAMRWAGAGFLALYGLRSLWAAATQTEVLEAAAGTGQSLRGVVTATLVVTWANPHVYLDTVGLLGAVAAQYAPSQWVFGAGALSASCLFFLLLGYGAKALAPLFARPVAWRVLDAVVGLTMLGLSAKLVFSA